jgi:hypothetical protein
MGAARTQINYHDDDDEPSSFILFIYAADIQSGHHDATQSISSADSVNWSRGGAAVVSGSGAEKILLLLLLLFVVYSIVVSCL